MKFGNATKMEVRVLTANHVDGTSGGAIQVVIDIGNCPFTNKARAERAVALFVEQNEGTPAYHEVFEDVPWHNDKLGRNAYKAMTNGKISLSLFIQPVADEEPVTLDLPTRRTVKAVQHVYEIRLQGKNKNGDIQTIGAIDTHTCRDLNALKKYVRDSDTYADFNNVQWHDYPLSVDKVKENTETGRMIRVTEVTTDDDDDTDESTE